MRYDKNNNYQGNNRRRGGSYGREDENQNRNFQYRDFDDRSFQGSGNSGRNYPNLGSERGLTPGSYSSHGGRYSSGRRDSDFGDSDQHRSWSKDYEDDHPSILSRASDWGSTGDYRSLMGSPGTMGSLGRDYRSDSDWRASHDDRYSRGRHDHERRSEHHDSSLRGMWESAKDFFGVGPKGYTRSDDRIREDVSEALMRDPAVDASSIEVEIQNGKVILKGHVNSKWMKRRAEDCAEEISGVQDVQNELEVQKESSINNATMGSSFDSRNAMSRMEGTSTPNTGHSAISGSEDRNNVASKDSKRRSA